MEGNMANISAAEVKKLREMTGAGMMDCKKALQDGEGDFDKAVEFLREKGLAGVKKREGRTASNGLVHAYLHKSSPDLPPTVGVLLEPVSYTHLRAHETKANLVCRLLLEKK